MIKNIKASIIIPTKNPGVQFKSVLNAVLNQTTSFEYEVLVIDSGSNDGTLEYLNTLNVVCLRVHSIAPVSYGHGRTRNLAVSMTSGEFAVLITHDAKPVNDKWLAELVKVAESDASIAGVFGRHIAYPEADPYTRQELIDHFDGFIDSAVVAMDDPERYKCDQGLRQFLHFFSDNNALIRRSIWKDIPYPDVDFAEDQQWAKLIIEAGYKKAYAHDSVVYHSHQYTLVERMKRSFDESYAFKRYFGYVLCPGLNYLIRSWMVLTYLDARKSIKMGFLKGHLYWVIRRPFDNFMKVVGHYLGGIGNSLPDSCKKWFSWDARY